MGKLKTRHFNMISKKEWMDPCCWREVKYHQKKNKGYIDGKLHICTECGNKIITERDDYVPEYGDID